MTSPSEIAVPVQSAEAQARLPIGRPGDLDEALRVVTVTEGPLWSAAETFVYEIYREVGYCDVSERQRVEELQRWASRSVFHVVVDEDDRIFGTVRTIFGGFADLPVGQFKRIDFAHRDPLCELSSLAVRPSARSTGVIEHLYRAGWLHAFRAGATALTGVIESWLLDVFVKTYHLPFAPIGVEQHYLGGPSTPVAMTLDGANYEGLARTRPEFWRWTLEAIEAEEVRRWRLPVIVTDRPTAESQPVPR